MTRTELSQRRLLEAIAGLERRDHGIAGSLGLGIPVAVRIAEESGLGELAEVYRCLGDLAEAIQYDLEGASHG